MDPIRFPGASTPRSTPDQPPFGPALAKADPAGRNDATRENSASLPPDSRGEPGAEVEFDPAGADEHSRSEGPRADRSESKSKSKSSKDPAASGSEDASVEETSEESILVDAPGIGMDVDPRDARPIGTITEPVVDSGRGSSFPTDQEQVVPAPGQPGGMVRGEVTMAVSSTLPVESAISSGVPIVGADVDTGIVPGTPVGDTVPIPADHPGVTGVSATDFGSASGDRIPTTETSVSAMVGDSVDPMRTVETSGLPAISPERAAEVSRIEVATTSAESRQSPAVAGRIEVPDARSSARASTAAPTLEPSARPVDRRRSEAAEEKRPAAVARAEKVNQAVQDARLQSSASNPAASSAMVSESAPGSVRGTASTAQTLPNHSAGAAPESADEGRSRTMPGVGRGLETLARQRGGTLTMRLDPPSLGQLKLEMKMNAGRVTVLLTSASDSARSLLRDNLGSLRQALEDRGLAVDRLAVETAGRTSEGSSNQRSENRGDGQDARGGQETADRQDAGEGRSRGRRDDASDRRADQADDPQRPEVANFDEALVQAAASGN